MVRINYVTNSKKGILLRERSYDRPGRGNSFHKTLREIIEDAAEATGKVFNNQQFLKTMLMQHFFLLKCYTQAV